MVRNANEESVASDDGSGDREKERCVLEHQLLRSVRTYVRATVDA